MRTFAAMKQDRLYITEATDAGNLCIHLRFNDNTTQIVDVGEYIRRHPHPQYNRYLQPQHFRQFQLDHGNVVWGKNWDLMFPVEDMYKGVIG